MACEADPARYGLVKPASIPERAAVGALAVVTILP